jgi:hypothetical protein
MICCIGKDVRERGTHTLLVDKWIHTAFIERISVILYQSYKNKYF